MASSPLTLIMPIAEIAPPVAIAAIVSDKLSPPALQNVEIRECNKCFSLEFSNSIHPAHKVYNYYTKHDILKNIHNSLFLPDSYDKTYDTGVICYETNQNCIFVCRGAAVDIGLH
jgi:hypothetical protein